MAGVLDIGGHAVHIHKDVLSVFSAHPWRGNVRELRNILTYALYSMQTSETVLGLHHLPERFFQKETRDLLHGPLRQSSAAEETALGAPAQASERLADNRRATEYRTITEALEKCGGNKAKAAQLLGISRSYLYKKLVAFHITRPK